MIWNHVSTESEYREPLGAVRAGAAVRLALMAISEPTDIATDYEVAMLIGNPEGDWKEVLMERKTTAQGAMWTCTWSAPKMVGAYWYYFRIRRGEELFFYGANYGKNSGKGVAIAGVPSCYQLTVFEKDFETPKWFQGATMYQIFPDRFARGRKANLTEGIHYHRSMGRKVYEHKNWEEIPYYQAQVGEKDYNPSDFFGGDLEGIRQHLDYFKELGITCLYLNPIVEADSNHRYNAADYKMVDPILGTEQDLKRLFEEAEERGIRILLDGVFSHTGADSIYFNKNNNYPGEGAYQSASSPYAGWFNFDRDRRQYKSWWGFESLPEVNELNPSWQKYIIKDDHSVFRFWLDMGAYGFRLDVADELPDSVIELMRRATKLKNPEKVLLGEVWEDATTKESYGQKRTYALGKGLDSVMNYPFRNAVIAWLTGWNPGKDVADFLNAQNANYPQPMYHSLMNLLSSHDVARIRSVLGAGTENKHLSRPEQAAFVLDYTSERRAMRLSRLAMALQFVIPGVPSVYYGDEYGMCGFGDPFNRGPLEKKDPELMQFVKKLGQLRRRESVLQTGSMSAIAYGERGLVVLRMTSSADMAAGVKPSVCLTLLNPLERECTMTVSLRNFTEGLDEAERQCLMELLSAQPESVTLELGARQVVPTVNVVESIDGWQVKVELSPLDMAVVKIG